MNYIGLINNIKEVALELNTVNSFYDGDVYNNWNNQEVRYGSINVGLESTTRTDNTVIYNVVIYYADRLLQDKSNKNGIWTDATNTITSIINGIDNSITYEGPLNITPFEQKFADYLAGGYARVGLEVNFDLGDCDLDESQYIVPAIFITHNGVYNVTDYEIADVNIPVPSLTELDVTENGTYTAENYDGYSQVNVNVPAEKPETTLTQTITTNGTQTFNPPTGYVFDKAVITTNIKTWSEEYNQALTTITELRQQVSQDTQTIANLNAQINNLNAQILLKERTISELQAAITQKDAQIAAKDATIQALQNQVSELTAERNRLLSVISDLNDTIADKNATIARLNEMIASVGSIKITNNGFYHPSGNQLGWNEVEVEVSAQKPEVDLVETVTTNDTYTYNPPEGYAFRSATFTVNIKTWEEEYNQALQTISELQATITEKDATISDLNSQITSLNNQIIQKDLQIRNLQDEIATKDATIASQAQQISSLNSQIESLQADIASLNNTIAEKNQEIQSLNAQISSLNTTILQQQVQIAQLQRQIDSVTTLSVNRNNQTYTPPSGVLGWNEVTVAIPEEVLTETIGTNGGETQTFNPTPGSVFSQANITVDVSNELETESVTSASGNGQTYTPSSGNIGFSSFTVNIPEESLTDTVGSGTHHYEPTTGALINSVDITVDVSSELQTKEATVNKTTVTPDNGKIGLSSVSVNIPEEELTRNVTQNHSTLVITPETAGELIKSATVNFDYTINNQDKTVTTNNTTVTADQGYDGLREVTVDLDIDPITVDATNIGQTITAASQNLEGFSQVTVDIDTETLSETIMTGGQHVFTPQTADFFDEAVINVPLSTKTVTRDGQTYVAGDDSQAGYSSVTVNIDKESPVENVSTISNTTVTITPQTSGKLIDQATVNITVPKETVTESYTLQGHNDIHTITPTQGKLIDSATLTLDYTPNNQDLTGANKITNNGTYTAGSGYDGLGTVYVDVDTAKPTETLTETIGTNGGQPQTFTPTPGYVFDEAIITVDVSSELESGSVTSSSGNGQTYTPGTGKIGFDSFEVNIPVDSLQPATITTNDTYTYTPTSGHLFSGASITVNVQPNLESSVDNYTINNNGSIVVTPSLGYDGLSDVEVTASSALQDKVVTQNGIIHCDNGYFGLNDVEVAVTVPQTVTLTQAEYDALPVKDPNTYYAITDAVGQSLIPAIITQNGTFTYTPTGNYKFLSDVEVTVAVPETILGHLTETVTPSSSTQTFNFTPGTGLDGWKDAAITVNVPLAEKTGANKITANGTYNASSDNVLGYSEVEVDIPAPTLSTLNATQNNTTYRASQLSVNGWDEVSVAIPVQSKTGNDGISTITDVNVRPDSGYDYLTGVDVHIPTEAKTESYTLQGHNDQHTFNATSGYLMSSDTITLDYTANNITKTGANKITTNDTYTVPSGYDGFGTIEVDVPQNTVGVKPSSITANGTYLASTDNLDGYSEVTVAIPTEHGTGTFTTNTPSGTPTRITPTAGSYFDYVDITVNVPQNTVAAKSTTITENGTYVAQTTDSIDGYSQVTVNVPSIGYLEMTQAQYDALQVKDPNTIYLITD